MAPEGGLIVVERISWRTWIDERSVRDSKAHLAERWRGRALCGVAIPNEGNGIEYDECFDEGECKNCRRAWLKNENIEIAKH